MLRSALPISLCLLLLALSFVESGLLQDYRESVQVQRRLRAADERLEQVRGLSVAASLEERNYQALVSEFAELTKLGDPEHTISKGEVAAQIAQFVAGVTKGLQEEPFVLSNEQTQLIFRSVSPGQRQELTPFLSVDFEINLEGRFFALGDFFSLLSRIAQEQQCAVSIGELQLTPVNDTSTPGRLLIKLPLRAYFYEQ